jgi:hypothetical protein
VRPERGAWLGWRQRHWGARAGRVGAEVQEPERPRRADGRAGVAERERRAREAERE